MNGDRMETVASFREPYKAHLAAGYLNDEGIESEIVDENTVTMNWVLSQAVGGVKLKVRVSDLVRARGILTEVTAEGIDNRIPAIAEAEPDRCPSCGSTAVEPRKFARWSLLVAVVFMLPMFFPLKKWKCRDCGHVWR